MNHKIKYIISITISLIIYFTLVMNSNTRLNTIIKLTTTGISMPYWLLLATDFILFPVLGYLIADSIIKRD